MTRSTSHLCIVATLAIARPLFADEVPADTGAETPAPRYPRSVIARPLTLPSQLFMFGFDAGANSDFSAMTGAPIIGYGITDELEVQVPYVFATRDFEARGSIGLDVGYAFLRGALDGKLEAIARIRGGYNTLDGVATPLMLGVHVQYNILPWLCVMSGMPGTQQIRISLAKDADNMRPMDISLPVAIGVQPLETLYVQLDTKLFQIGLHESEHLLIGRDITPVALTVVWNALAPLDLQAAIGTDLSNEPGDSMTFLLGARYYAGTL